MRSTAGQDGALAPRQVLEGVVIVEFPSVATARAWDDSAAYEEVTQYRFTGAHYCAVLVKGNAMKVGDDRARGTHPDLDYY